MAGYWVFLALFLLVPAAVDHVVGDRPEPSIDCGADINDSVGSQDTSTSITYFSDRSYVDDAGENRVVAGGGNQTGTVRPIESLRIFPGGGWNCYALPTDKGTTYLVRAQFEYGNYDGKNSRQVQFDLRLGTQDWATITLTSDVTSTKEAVFVAWASWAPICLAKTGNDTPFVSVLELRELGAGLYPPVSANQSLAMYSRRMMGTDVPLTRRPNDPQDRLWSGMSGPQWTNLSTHKDILPDPSFNVTSLILQTAIEPLDPNSRSLTVIVQENQYSSGTKYMAFLHFADFQNATHREFHIYINSIQLGPSSGPFSPTYLKASCVRSSEFYVANDGRHNITLVGTLKSKLPPMLNALEIYTLVDMDDTETTRSQDFEAIMGIKLHYDVKKNWTGDPCYPSWNGVKCKNSRDNDLFFKLQKIIYLDLSNSRLTGGISDNFTLLMALEILDLSYNNLNGFVPDALQNLPALKVLNLSGNSLSGPFPDFICKNNTGQLIFRYDQPLGPLCGRRTNDPTRIRLIFIHASVVVAVLVVVVLVLGYIIRRKKKNTNVPTRDDGSRYTQFENVSGSRKGNGENLQNNENRRFTYKELKKTTDNFRGFIGHGGFGHVYYGLLENGTEVAVKMRSESSLHGLDQFLAEVESLTKVNHRNLVSLVGYCWEEDHMALVYEYLPQGSLFDHLRGRIGDAETLTWEIRVRIALEAAQGLDYLHNGCNLPIIHRDVKTSNILLGRNLEAKLADFGLSKSYLTDSQTHISATAAGTTGYMDPEYYHTGRLTESSDVYSFGVVLLEIATGEPPVVPGHGHIVHRVSQMITDGEDISSIADVRLHSAFDVTSMWKVVDTAIKCTSDAAAQRPTMATVVAQLKESLALVRARERDSSVGESLGVDISSFLSTDGPSAR